MKMEDWDKRPNGDFDVYPVTGWSIAALMGGAAGGVRLEYARDPTGKNLAALQVVMSSAKLRELADAMVRLANLMDRQSKPKGPLN